MAKQEIVYAERLEDGSKRIIARVPTDTVHQAPAEYLAAVQAGRNESWLEDAVEAVAGTVADVADAAADAADADAEKPKGGKAKPKGKSA